MISYIFQSPFERSLDIFFFGDLQWGANGFDEEAWDQFKREFKASKNAVALGLGDYGDISRPTMRDRLYKAADTDTRKQLDNIFLKDHDNLIDKLSFLEGRLIGLHNGHHCWEFQNGTNSDQRLASALKAPYLGWMAAGRIGVPYTSETIGHKRTRNLVFTILSMHGQANARRTGGAALWLENNFLPSFIADAYVMGHNCKGMSWTPLERNTIRRGGPAGIILSLPRLLNVGGFHRGYTNGWETTYVERNGFSPQPISWGIVRLKTTNRKLARTAKGVDSKCRKGSCSLDVETVIRHPV